MDSPNAQQQEDKHIAVSSLRNRPLTGAEAGSFIEEYTGNTIFSGGVSKKMLKNEKNKKQGVEQTK